jgi:hypothetical protein
MEPRKEEQQKTTEPREEAKKSRFRIEKLEERIAPGKAFGPGGSDGNNDVNEYGLLKHGRPN